MGKNYRLLYNIIIPTIIRHRTCARVQSYVSWISKVLEDLHCFHWNQINTDGITFGEIPCHIGDPGAATPVSEFTHIQALAMRTMNHFHIPSRLQSSVFQRLYSVEGSMVK